MKHQINLDVNNTSAKLSNIKNIFGIIITSLHHHLNNKMKTVVILGLQKLCTFSQVLAQEASCFPIMNYMSIARPFSSVCIQVLMASCKNILFDCAWVLDNECAVRAGEIGLLFNRKCVWADDKDHLFISRIRTFNVKLNKAATQITGFLVPAHSNSFSFL